MCSIKLLSLLASVYTKLISTCSKSKESIICADFKKYITNYEKAQDEKYGRKAASQKTKANEIPINIKIYLDTKLT